MMVSFGKYGRSRRENHWDSLDEAVEQYNIALGFDRNDPKTHYKLATALVAQSKIDAGLEHFERALRLDPKGEDYRYDYGYALERLGRSDEAAVQYQAAIKFK